VEVLGAMEVQSVRRQDPFRIVRLGDGTEVSCKALILASGVAVRLLDVPGVHALTGRGVYYGAARTEAATYQGERVCIVGGANSAGQGALFFSKHAARVAVLVRADSLRQSMASYLVDRIEATENIEVMTRTAVTEVRGENGLDSVVVQDLGNGSCSTLDVAAMFIFIGAAPRTGMVEGLVALDDKGFVLTGADLMRDGKPIQAWDGRRDPFLLETSVPGIFAVGDLRAGSGKRVASAVGEGSACVGVVHRYLESV
jgi:thioredoxin reductase (NADPH)